MAEIVAVDLTDQERALYDAICWNPQEWLRKPAGERLAQLDRMGELAESLLDRKAIPEVRLAYFTAPEMNPGGYGKSRQEVFIRNGTSGPAILRHPHFLEYLWYFIHGPRLPAATIQGFCKIIEDDVGTSGQVLDQLRTFVRQEVRTLRLNPGDAADEFFKLAHEIDKPNLAESVRSAAKQVR